MLDIHKYARHTYPVIKKFADKATEAIFKGEFSKKFGPAVSKLGRRKLAMLDAAASITDLRVPPNNRLEALKGDRRGQHSIRINDQFRVCFRWKGGDAYDVEIVDYH
jgi:proteic killer suppression protein